MKVVEIDLTDSSLVQRYDRLFEECPHAFIQQSTYWSRVIKDLGPDIPIFLLCSEKDEDVAGLPLYLYKNPSGNILTSVPQPGPMGGIFYRQGLDAETIANAYRVLLNKAVDIAQRNGCIALTLISNPFYDDLNIYKSYMEPTYVFENFTQHIPLETIFKGNKIALRDYNRRSNLSRNLKKANSFGYTVEFCEDKNDLRKWYEVHRQRHVQLGAMPLEYKLFENMFDSLVPLEKARLILVKDGDTICSGCFFIYHEKIMDVFMLSMNPEYVGKGVNYLNVDHSLYWARGLGVDTYNWQSSRDRGCGVYRFKKQWGSVEAGYYFLTKLFCAPDRILEIGIDRIKEEYIWHYVVPFGIFEEGFGKKYFKK
jgi:hypothetical protein